jgi:hypothetical protein
MDRELPLPVDKGMHKSMQVITCSEDVDSLVPGRTQPVVQGEPSPCSCSEGHKKLALQEAWATKQGNCVLKEAFTVWLGRVGGVAQFVHAVQYKHLSSSSWNTQNYGLGAKSQAAKLCLMM